MKARKKRSGSLEKRGGVWLARWMVGGKRFTRSTGESDKSKALKKLDDFTLPYRLKDERRIIEVQSARLRGIDEELQTVSNNLPSLKISDGWSIYERSQSRPRSGNKTMGLYKFFYDRFVDWAKYRHPEISELRQVSREVAEEYAQEMLGGTPQSDIDGISMSKTWIDENEERFKALESDKLLPDEEKRVYSFHKKRSMVKIMHPMRPSSFNINLYVLSLVWRHVAQNAEARITVNPWSFNKDTSVGIRRIKLTKGNRQHSRRALTMEEVYNLLNTAKGELKLLIAFGFYTGLRMGDICRLTWGNLDRATWLLTVTSQKTYVETKTFIHPRLRQIIEQEAKKGSNFILPECNDLYINHHAKLGGRIRKLFESVGIQTTYRNNDSGYRGLPDATFHSLRHTFVSLLRNNGVTIQTAQALAGHTNPTMTEHYTHSDGRAALVLPDIMNATDRAEEKNVLSVHGRIFTLEDLRIAVSTWTNEERAEAIRIIEDAASKR